MWLLLLFMKTFLKFPFRTQQPCSVFRPDFTVTVPPGRTGSTQAVGKMTVAESLRDKLKYNLMMNHDSIKVADLVIKHFGLNTNEKEEKEYRFGV